VLHRFAKNGTWLDPTIRVSVTGADAVECDLSEFRELVRSIRQNHVAILAGTDSSSVLEEKGDLPGTSLHDELALLVDAGFTPSEALRAATLNPRASWGSPSRWEPSMPEKTANLVLLEVQFRCKRYTHTKRIAAVILEGRYLDRLALTSCLPETVATVSGNPGALKTRQQ